MQTKSITSQELEELCRKAEQTRSIQNSIREKWECINKALMLYVGIGSAVSAMFIFSSLGPKGAICLGIFSASVFIASVVPAILNLDSKILERSIAVKLWGGWIRQAKLFCKGDMSQVDQVKGEELFNSYTRIMSDTPLISDDDFLKYKAQHLQKVAISRYLDEKPFKGIEEIKNQLSK